RPTYLRTPTDNFFSVLVAAYPLSAGWTYASAANELSDNSLTVRTYDAEHGGEAQRNCPRDARPQCVGAEFNLQYTPHNGDPMAGIHWIQVITDNHNETDIIGHSNQEIRVDVVPATV